MELELSDANALQAVLNIGQATQRPRQRRDDGAPPTTNQHSTMALRRCKCGHCRVCLDNAKWERIFQEKFADPNYYTPRLPPHASALDSII
jgi:hypothetical protein